MQVWSGVSVLFTSFWDGSNAIAFRYLLFAGDGYGLCVMPNVCYHYISLASTVVGLVKEINAIAASARHLAAEREATIFPNVDAQLVSLSFATKAVGRLVVRMNAILKKASNEFPAQHAYDLSTSTTIFTKLATNLLETKFESIWIFLGQCPITFMTTALQGQPVSKELEARTTETLGSRQLATALMAPSTSGFTVLLSEDEIKIADDRFKQLSTAAGKLSDMLLNCEANAGGKIHIYIFSDTWHDVFQAFAVELDLLGEGAQHIFQQVAPLALQHALQGIARGFAARIRVFFESVLKAHPWFDMVLIRELKKINWPTTLPADDDDSTMNVQLERACAYLETKAADSIEAVKSRKWAALATFQHVLKVGEGRRDVVDAFKSKLIDVKHTTKTTAALKTLLNAAEDAIGKAEQIPTRLLAPAIQSEREFATVRIAELYSGLLERSSTLLDDCHPAAKKPELDFSTVWADTNATPVDADAMLVITNSSEANDLTQYWVPLVNHPQLIRFVLDAIQIPKFVTTDAAIKGVHEANHMDDLATRFAVCRDKVAELCAVKALYRPRKKDETRTAIVEKALATVDKLEGSLSPKLELLLQTAINAPS